LIAGGPDQVRGAAMMPRCIERSISMSKAKKKALSAPSARAANAAIKAKDEPKIKKIDPGSKQSHVIALLSSPGGTTIAAMMKTTGWQQHSMRGFLAGVVRKKLKLGLNSKKFDGTRVYRIDSGHGTGTTSKSSKRRAA
jgi:hypothetical protein